MSEVLKDVVGYEGLYKVSNMGNVYSSRSKKLLTQYYNQKGMKRVCLSKDGKSKNMSVHRLVMLSFVGDSELQVDHINENRSDNRLSNLEYVTNQENSVRYQRNRGNSAKNMQDGKYRAEVWHNGKNHWAGIHITKEKAQQARARMKLALMKNQALDDILNLLKEGV